MADHTAILGATRSLRRLLEDHITSHPQLQVSGQSIPIDVRSPDLLTGGNSVSLWLYRVSRDPDTLNAPPRRVLPDLVARSPVRVDLYYLVTPHTDDESTAQTLLGRVLQVFNDHAVMGGAALQAPLDPARDELHITLEPLSLEDQTRLWTSLDRPYRVGVAYCVSLVAIESDHQPRKGVPVAVRESRYEQIVGS
jgi:hypothetical protein